MVVLALAALLALGLVFTWPTISAYASTGAAYSARVVCSCRYIGNRSLGDCRKDMEPGTEIVRVSEDTQSRRIHASVPFVASEIAEYREGWGCILVAPGNRTATR